MRGRWSDHKQQEKLVERNRQNKKKIDKDKNVKQERDRSKRGVEK